MQLMGIEEYIDELLRVAIYKCNNIHDAQDITQDTIIAALSYLKSGKKIDKMKPWLLTVLNRKFYDLLREKYRLKENSITYGMNLYEEDLYDQEDNPKAYEIRREIAYLTNIYREVIARYYMNGHSVKRISDELGIPVGTVKSRLSSGREKMKGSLMKLMEFNETESYKKQSYQPERLIISNDGSADLNEVPSLKANDLIRQNVLIAAYESPKTAEEISRELGIPTAYIENILDILEKAQLMKSVKGRFYTDFPIYNAKDSDNSWNKQTDFLNNFSGIFMEETEKLLNALNGKSFFKAQNERAKVKLEFFTTLYFYQDVFFEMRKSHTGFEPPIDRGNGSRWTAWGNLVTDSADDREMRERVEQYGLSGLRSSSYRDMVWLSEFDTPWDALSYIYAGMKIPFQCNEAAGLIYALTNKLNPEDVGLPAKYLENIPEMIEAGLIYREGENLNADLPVISQKEYDELVSLISQHSKVIFQKVYDDFLIFLKSTEKKLPSHLKNVPKWQRYIESVSVMPMRLAHIARDKGLIFKGVLDSSSGHVYHPKVLITK